VQFRRAFIDGLTGDAQLIVDVVRVSVRLPRRAKEAAELAVDITDVRRIEVTIDVEVGRAAMLSAAHSVRQLAERVQVISIEEGEAILK
jgi:hypothetical protein